MSAGDVVKLVATIGLPLFVVLYVLLMPDKAQMIAGWLWSFVARVFRRADKKAVALRVQGEINSARSVLVENAPEHLIDGKLKIRWTDADQAQATVRDGDVVVFMRRSAHHEENVAHALMAYLPRAVVPRVRRYVDPNTMRAADLTLAKAVLGGADASEGSLNVFFEQHLDPARDEDDGLRAKIAEMDEIDLHGWLLRVLLQEFRHLGDALYPGEADPRCEADADGFARWLHRLAARAPGDDTLPLAYEGPYLRVAVVLVAIGRKLAEKGSEPYRKQAKRLIYSGKYDAVYLMGRDHNIWAVEEIAESLSRDGRVQSACWHEYALRPDFKKRKLQRERAIVACLRARTRVATGAGVPDESLSDVEVEAFDPTEEIRAYREAAGEVPQEGSARARRFARPGTTLPQSSRPQ